MMNNRKSHRIIIGGGGTGGHIFPAISIANALKNLDPAIKILFVGAKNRMEMEKVPEAGYEIIGLPVIGYQRRFTLKNVAFFFRLLMSMHQSNKIIRDFKPHVAVGVGGYASGPILKAAVRRKIPVLLQEQNSYAGITNRLLARSARKICVAYDGMEKYFPPDRIVLTGNPVRQELKNISYYRQTDVTFFGLEPGKNTILVIGGSLGARTLNNCIRDGLSRFNRNDLQVIWQTGKGDFETAKNAVDMSGLNNIKVLPFISEMHKAFAAAQMIVSRAGAGIISELCLVGKPVILVPSPNVAGDHQTRNAGALVSRKAALMVPDNLAAEHLVDKILELIEDRQQMEELSRNISEMALPDAAEKIADEIINLINN